MKRIHRAPITALSLVLLSGTLCFVRAQVGKGLIDVNVASEAELLALPNMTPVIVKALLDNRPFLSVLDLNVFLLSQKLTPAQAMDFYRKAFVQINLNTATADEFMLVPGSGKRMSAEFAEYRPWKNWAQFDKEIGKYVGQQETDRFKQYMFIPIDLNTASDDVLLTIPGINPGLIQTLKKSRPWKSKDQFDKEIGKNIGPKEAARFWRYVVIQ